MVLDHDCQGCSGTLPSVAHSQGIPRYNQEETAFSDRRGCGAAAHSQFGKDQMRKAQHTRSGRDFLDTARQARLSTITDNLNFINIEAFHTSGQY